MALHDVCLWRPTNPVRAHQQTPFPNGEITERMKEFNTKMSAVRVSVKWLFGDEINTYRYMDSQNNLKIGMSSAEKAYIALH